MKSHLSVSPYPSQATEVRLHPWFTMAHGRHEHMQTQANAFPLPYPCLAHFLLGLDWGTVASVSSLVTPWPSLIPSTHSTEALGTYAGDCGGVPMTILDSWQYPRNNTQE